MTAADTTLASKSKSQNSIFKMSQIQPPSLAAVAKAVVNSGSDTNPLIDLFEKARAATSKTLPKDSWYLIVVSPTTQRSKSSAHQIIKAATFLTTDGGHNWGELYKYLISEYGTTPEERKNINRRLRQIVIKAWCLIGIPRATDGYIALKKVEAPEDIADEWNREELVNNPEKAKAQGGSWFDKLFKEEKGPILQAMGSFPDLGELCPDNFVRKS